MDFLYGMLGLVAFEALKIYNRLWGWKKTVIPNNKGAYFITLAILAMFAGASAQGLADGNILRAIVIGFSVPSGLKAIVETARSHTSRRQDSVDDIESSKPNFPTRVIIWVDDFLRFR